MSIRERQRGQPAPIATKVSTQAVQKRACPQGTKATPAGEAIKHTSHVEKYKVVAGAAAVVGVVVVGADELGV